jgi:hypothetical protein
MQRLLASWWEKDGRPALYLPSSHSECQIDGEDAISCRSKPRRSSLLGRPYSYHFLAYLESFDTNGRFVMRYWPEVIEVLPVPPGAYGTGEDSVEPPSEAEVRLKVERPAEELSCEMFRDTHLDCEDSKGGSHDFKRLDKGEETAADAVKKGALAGTESSPAAQPAASNPRAVQLAEPQTSAAESPAHSPAVQVGPRSPR